jgi:hypothetical protein
MPASIPETSTYFINGAPSAIFDLAQLKKINSSRNAKLDPVPPIIALMRKQYWELES